MVSIDGQPRTTTDRGGVSLLDPYRLAPTGARSFLHRLNPLGKAAALLPPMVAMMFTRDIDTPLVFIVLTLLLLVVGARLRLGMVLVLALGLPVFVLLVTLSFAVWTDAASVDQSVTLLQVGGYQFYLGALQVGFATALRLAALLLMATLGGVTTTGPDLVRAVVQHLRVPYRIGYTALAAYRFVPRFRYELDVIRQAHRVRGVSGGRSPIARLRRYSGYVVPLLAGAIRHAERVALAMDSRAFGAHPTRTERYLVPFHVRDGVFVVVCWLVSAVILVFAPLVP